MNDRVKIYIGLALFVALVTFPIWRAIGAANPTPPDLAKAVRGAQCIEWSLGQGAFTAGTGCRR